MPAGIGYEWTGQSYEERLAGSQAPALYTISLLVVFLCLAALYESWSIPVAVILAVPLGILGALLAAHLRGLPNDVFFKVGLITTIGLATKNAILIVQFAINLMEQGKGLIEATLEAVHIRLRPILMTSFAFILGVMPLAVNNGAGSASQNAIGTGVIGGMAAAVLLGIFFVPILFRRRAPHFQGRIGPASFADARNFQAIPMPAIKRMNKFLLPIALAAVTLAGCTMIPKYHQPPAPVSKSWPENAASE